MAVRTFQRSFGGGEVTPELFGRIDDSKFQSGLSTCRNFITKPHGPAENRAGFAFVRETRASHLNSRLIPFTYSTTQTMVLEFGNGYLRFHTQGATLLAGSPAAYNGATAYAIADMVTYGGSKYYCIKASTGNLPTNTTYWYQMSSDAYEIPTPYTYTVLKDLHYVQSADVLTIVHPDYPPMELQRQGATKWVIQAIDFSAGISAPTGVSATATGHTAVKYNYSYVVTAIGSDGLSESVSSSVVTAGGNLFETGGICTIAWSATTGAARYNVYKLIGGLYGYIGQTDTLSIIDNNIAPDLSKTPPTYEAAFTGAGNYPAAVSYFEQRRVFAGTTNKPQNIWMTKSGTEKNLSYSLPIRDDDRISFRVAAREANTVRHIVPMSALMLMTSAAEWRVTSQNSDAITPTSINVVPQSYVGASNVQPQIVNNSLIYCASRGGHVRELGYSNDHGGYITGDLSLRAPHLFDGFELVDMAFSKAPYPILWFVSTSGKLIGLTYVPEQQIGAWHWHDTDGLFESCCVVSEGSEDVLYVIVNRTIGGITKRYVERMATRMIGDQEDCFFVDCGATYSGAAATTISGLSHLEGKTVSILANGAVHPQRVVTGGQITLDHASTKVQIGLPITADIQTLPIAAQIDNGFGQGKVKNVNQVWLRVYKSSGLFAGPSLDKLREIKQRTTEPYGSPPELVSREGNVVTVPEWTDGGQIYIRQSDPLPLTLVSLTMEIEVGG